MCKEEEKEFVQQRLMLMFKWKQINKIFVSEQLMKYKISKTTAIEKKTNKKITIDQSIDRTRKTRVMNHFHKLKINNIGA